MVIAGPGSEAGGGETPDRPAGAIPRESSLVARRRSLLRHRQLPGRRGLMARTLPTNDVARGRGVKSQVQEVGRGWGRLWEGGVQQACGSAV